MAPPPPEGRRSSNTRARHAQIHELCAQGMAIKAIARKLGLDRKTVRNYAHAQTADALIGPSASDGRDVLGPFKDYLHARIRDGVTDIATLAEQIRARGYRGSDRTLRR